MHDTYVLDVEEPGMAAPERLGIRERLVVAPCSGRFVPLPPETFTCEGEWVETGQALAHVTTNTD